MRDIGREYWIKREGNNLSIGDTLTCRVALLIMNGWNSKTEVLPINREVLAKVTDTGDNGMLLVAPIQPLKTLNHGVSNILL